MVGDPFAEGFDVAGDWEAAASHGFERGVWCAIMGTRRDGYLAGGVLKLTRMSRSTRSRFSLHKAMLDTD